MKESSMNPTLALEARDVAIHYGGVKAVDGVDLTLAPGQIRGLIGPNGAGKSTAVSYTHLRAHET